MPISNALGFDFIPDPDPPPADTQPPTVDITSHSNGAIISGEFTVKANANDNVAVTRVSFALGTINLGYDTDVQYEKSYDIMNADFSLQDGNYLLIAIAFDAAGNYAVDEVTVQVQNGQEFLALVVGGETEERFTRNAFGFYNTLIDHYSFEAENIYLLTTRTTIDGNTVPRDRATSSANVQWATNQLETADLNDQVIIYWTGHGGTDIISADGDLISASSFSSYLDDIDCGKMFIFLGPCHSGSFIDDLNDKQNRAIYTSCSTNQSGWGNGTHSFYPWLIYKGLDSDMDADDADTNNNNKVSLFELFNYCVDYINTLESQYNFTQDPQRWVGTEIGNDANAYIGDEIF